MDLKIENGIIENFTKYNKGVDCEDVKRKINNTIEFLKTATKISS